MIIIAVITLTGIAITGTGLAKASEPMVDIGLLVTFSGGLYCLHILRRMGTALPPSEK